MLSIPTLFCPNVLGHEPDPNDDTGLNSGGPASNPYTEYDGGEGPGQCSGEGMPNYWVSTATRELAVQDTDFSYKGLGPGISITRTHNMPRNSAISVFGMFGDRWTFPYESLVDHRGQSEQPPYKYVWLKKGSGQRLKYYIDLSKAPPLEASLPVGVYDRLTWYGGYWLLEEKDTRLTYRYDQGAGKSYSPLTSIADPDGNEVLIDYNANETIQAIFDPVGRATTFQYDANKRCTSMTTPDGRTATYQYDSGGHLIRTVDLNGSETVFTYDAQHYMVATTAAGKTTLFDRAGGDKIQKVTDARGNITQYGTRTNGGILVTDPEGRIRFYDSSQQGFTSFNGYLDKDLKPLSLTLTSYSNGRPSEFMDANGKTTKIKYDARGNLTEVTDPSGNKTTYAYDANDNRVTKTNRLNETWHYEYDDRHHLIRVISPMGNETTMTYDNLGQLTGISDANKNSRSFSYDDFGNLESVTDPLGHKTQFAYDPYGLRRTALTEARGYTTQFEYDENDRITKLTHSDGTFRSYAYDCCANASVTDENGNTTTLARDPLLNLTQITDPLGKITMMAYDKNSNLISVTNALGDTTAMTYDAVNRLVTQTDPKGGSIQRGYDPNGNLISLKDQRGKKTDFTYDLNNARLSTADPLGKAVKLTRDALGRVITATNARGGKIDLTYDADGRVIKKAYDGTTVATYTYDSIGNMTSVTDSGGKTTYGYNARSEVTATTYPDGKALSLTYDPAENVSSISYPGGLVVNYTYDSRNRIATTAWSGNSISYFYDQVGNVTKETRSNGTETNYTYDKNALPIQITHQKAASPFAQMNYTRNAVGNTVQETRTLPLPAHIVSESVSASYNDVNQVSKWGADNYAYDLDGNLTSISGTESLSIVYDPSNVPAAISGGGVTANYTYNGWGHRTKAVRGSTTRNYHYDLDGRLLFETDQTGQVTVSYVYTGGRLTAMVTGAGSFFYHFDKTGNTVAITDGGGTVTSAYVYDAFGNITNQSGSLYNPFTFAGALGVMDEADGIYFMKNRYFDAETGKFIQKDPIGYFVETNLYRYVFNNPIEKTDSLGLGPDNDKSADWGMGIANFGAGLLAWTASAWGAITYIGTTTTLVGASTVVAPLTIAGLLYYGFGRFQAAKEQLTSEKPTFNYRNKCEVVAASPLGGVPFAKGIANLWFPEGDASTAAEEIAKDTLKLTVMGVLKNN